MGVRPAKSRAALIPWTRNKKSSVPAFLTGSRSRQPCTTAGPQDVLALGKESF